MRRLINGFALFSRAYNATKHQILVSMLLLLMVTLVFAFFMWLAEGGANPEFSFWDALVWTFVKYVEDPADITSSPVTVLGQIVGTMVGVLGIAIFAVPAGLIGSGLMDAMDEKKHENEIEEYKQRLHKAFRRVANKSLRTYLNGLQDKGGDAFARMNFVPEYISASKLLVRHGMELKDVYEVCDKFEEFRLKNLADALNEEEQPEDRFVVEYFPKNRSYGCCIERGSKVTIVCPTAQTDVGTGWFAYYIAKMGGFNFICKDVEADIDEVDSFYNMSEVPLYNKKSRASYTTKDKEAIAMLNRKEQLRADYLADIKNVCKGEGAWCIILTEHQKTTDNVTDIHFADNTKNATNPTVKDVASYNRFYTMFAEQMQLNFGLTSVFQSSRYPLMKSNLAYRLQKEGLDVNAFVLRPSSHMMVFDTKKLTYAYCMARIISEVLDNGKGIENNDVKDFATTAFGYSENYFSFS